jgi:hypothetical protein
MADAKASAVTAHTPGAVIKNRQAGLALARIMIASPSLSSQAARAVRSRS